MANLQACLFGLLGLLMEISAKQGKQSTSTSSLVIKGLRFLSYNEKSTLGFNGTESQISIKFDQI